MTFISSKNHSAMKKSKGVNAILILNTLLVIAGFTFYIVFSMKAKSGGETLIDPSRLLNMALIYTVMYIGIVISIFKKQIRGIQLFSLRVFVASAIIVFAPIGLVLSLATLILPITKSVKNYFEIN